MMGLKFPELRDQGSRDFNDSTTNTLNTIHGNDELIAGEEMARPLSQTPVALSALANTTTTIIDSRDSISESSPTIPFAPPKVIISPDNITSTAINEYSLNIVNPNLTITPTPNITITPTPNISGMSSNGPLVMFRYNSMLSTASSHWDQTLQSTLNSPFPFKQRRKNLYVDGTLAILLIGTIIAYICVWKFEEKIESYLHVIFIFMIVAEVSIWERWYTAQRMRSEWDPTFIDSQNSESRLWAPWNDPELQQRIAQRQSRNTGVFDPEYPADFIPPPAYGIVRDSVLINPNTGQLVAGAQATALAPPEYDSLSLRSSRRSSTWTLQQRPESINTIGNNRRQSRLSILPLIQRLTNDPGEGSTSRETVLSLSLRRSKSAPMSIHPPQAAVIRTSSTGPKKVISRHHKSIGYFTDSHQNHGQQTSAPAPQPSMRD